MAKKNLYTIDIDSMTGDVTIDKTSKNTLDFNGKTWAQAIDTITSDGDNLVITTKNENDYKVILTDYFAKNGKHSIKYINTSGAGESDLAILDIVNRENIAGAAQIMTQSKNGKFTGSVFNDTITGGIAAEKIYGNGGNDTIDGKGGNDAITGGEGTNTILLYTGTSFGNDTVTLTKGEHLILKLADYTHTEETADPITTEVVGKDLVITVNKGGDKESSVTVKNYTKKDVLTSAGSFIIVDKNDTLLFNERRDFYADVNMYEGGYTKSSYTGTWINDDVDATGYVAKDKKGNVITENTDTAKGVTVNLGGASNRNYALGSIYSDTIKGGADNDNIWANKGNDVITGGTGTNYIQHEYGDGHDSVNLTKGEKFNLVLVGIDSDDVKVEYANKQKDIKVSYVDENGAEAGSVTLKNFGKKDVTNNSTKKDPHDTSEVNLRFGNLTNPPINLRDYFIISDINQSNFTGGWLRDYIDASESDELVKKNKHVNMVLNGGKGDDEIHGSRFADTLKGGDGDDVLVGHKGDDSFYGEGGNNDLQFYSGDGKDVVYSGKGEDTLHFVGDNNIQALVSYDLDKNGKDLIIKYGMDRTSSITVKDYIKKGTENPKCSVKYVQFGDGERILLKDAINYQPAEGVVVEGSGNIKAVNNTEFVLGSANDDNIDLTASTKPAVSAYAGEGNNIVLGNTGSNIDYTVISGSGDDTITTGKGDDVIDAGDGHNVITTTGSGTKTITVGDSTNSETNIGSEINMNTSDLSSGHEINAGDGNDTIAFSGKAYYSTINAGEGNNTISTASYTEGLEITTGDGDDTISLGTETGYNIDKNIINSGDGDDTITLGKGNNNVINAGNGNNKITVGDKEETSLSMNIEINSGSGNDEITLKYFGSKDEYINKINAGGGDNIISAYVNDATITTLDGDDQITLTDSGTHTINAGDGHNIIKLTGQSTNIITVGDSTDEETNIGSEITFTDRIVDNEIYAGDGKNTITFKGVADNVTIDAGDGGDTITAEQGSSAYFNIKTGSGDDNISLGEGNSYNHDNIIDAGDGDNTIIIGTLNHSNNNNDIKTGSGDDTITMGSGQNTKINAGAGDNKITLGYNGSTTTDFEITTLDGNDTITAYRSDNSSGKINVINAGGGNNTIITDGGKTKVTTLGGDDIITTGNRDDEIDAGDGHNVITAGAGKNIITVGNSTVTDPDDENYNIGSKITLSGDCDDSKITAGGGNDTITGAYYGDNIEINAGEGNNTISLGNDSTSSKDYKITTGGGNDTITVISSYNTYDKTNIINAGAGDNTITTDGNGITEITTLDGKQTITVGTADDLLSATHTISTGSGDDEITVYGSSNGSTITTTGGNNTIRYGAGQHGEGGLDERITTGDGNDKIYLGSDEGGIDNIIVNAGEGNNEIHMGKNSSGGKYTTGDGDDIIDFKGYSYKTTIDTGEGDNQITMNGFGYSNNITTGSGDDIITLAGYGGYATEDRRTTISAGAGHNIITINNGRYDITVGDSTDEETNIGSEITLKSTEYDIDYTRITGGSGNDKISVNNGDYLTINAGGGNDSITANDISYSEISVTDGDNILEFTANSWYDTITGGLGDDTISFKGTETYRNKVVDTEGNNTITSEGGNYYDITTGNGDDSIILAESKYHVIVSGDGEDTIKIGEAGTGYNNENTITAGDGNKTIIIGNGNRNTITTGNGNNTINVGNGDNNSVTTGSGDDTVTLDYGANIVVNTGAGADTITAYSGTINSGDGNDMITLKGNSNVALTMGKGDDTLDVSQLVAASSYYIDYNKGDGNDRVTGLTDNGVLRFNIDSDYIVTAERSEIEGHTNDLILTMYNQQGEKSETDSITIENYWDEGGDPVNISIFVNEMDIAQLPHLIKGEGTINGTNGNDYIVGSDEADTIYPKEGRDYIYSGKGNDVIDFERDGSLKTVHYNKGDGDLTLKNLEGYVELYMEDIEAETTVFERHGVDMYIVRALDNDQVETVIIEKAFAAVDSTGIGQNVKLYTKDGEYKGYIYNYPKVMNIYPDTETGILAGDEYVEQNLYYTNAASNRIIIPDEYDVANYVYDSNITNPDTLDLSWCVSEGFCLWDKDEDGNLVITSPIDCSLPYDERYKETNVVKTTIVGFYNGENSVKNFTFSSYTRDYSEISQLTNKILVTSEDEGETITGTWVQDRITQSGTINNITINSADGYDTIIINAINSATINGGKGNDTISAGGSAKNYLTGGVGNDSIIGTNTSQDEFLFSLGDGNDVISGGDINGAVDRIKIDGFADKNNPDLTHRFDGRDLILEYNYVDEVPQDSITIANYLDEHGVINSSIKYINYGDGEGGWSGERLIASSFGIDVSADEEHKNLVGTPFNDNLRTENSDIEGVTLNGGTGDDDYYSGQYSAVIECSDFGGHDEIYGNTLWVKEGYIKFTDLDLANPDVVKCELNDAGSMVIYYANSGDDPTVDGYVFPNSIKLNGYNTQYNPASEQYFQYNQLLGKDDTIGTANPEYTVLKLYKNTVNVEGSGRADGTKYRDVITGSAAFNDIYAQYGDDIILGSTGGDWAHGGAGDDLIDYSTIAQSSTLYGNTGNDTIYGGSEDDTIYGGSSSTASDNDGNDLIYGGDGNDHIWTGNGNNTVYGGNGKDYVYLGNGTNTIRTENGNDYVEGGLGNDTIYCGEGDDYVFESGGTNHIYGGTGSDELRAFNGNNTLYFSEGDGIDDVYFSSASGQTLKFLDQDFDDLQLGVKTEDNLFTVGYGDSGDKVNVHGLISGVTQMYVEDQNGDKRSIQYSYSDGGNTGTNGKDVLFGNGTTINNFWGKQGNDLFYSGGHEDNFRFNNGDGDDVIKVGTAESTLWFESSAIDDINFTTNGDDLVAKYNGGVDSVTVKNYLSGGLNFYFETSDHEVHNVNTEARNHINDTTSETVTGDVFNDYITINEANLSVAGCGGSNVYTFAGHHDVEHTLIVDTKETTDTITFTNLDNIGYLSISVDGDDIMLKDNDGDINLRIKDGFVENKKLLLKDNNTGFITLADMMENNHMYIVDTYSATFGDTNDTINIITGETQVGGGVIAGGGSDTVYVNRNNATVYTYNNLSGEGNPNNKDTSSGIIDAVISNATGNIIYAQSESNYITSNSETSDDSYFAYLDQTTRIDDRGGNDSIKLQRSDYSATDGNYKVEVSGDMVLNTYLFFETSSSGGISQIELVNKDNINSAAGGFVHNGIYLGANNIETITTNDGYSISSTNIAKLVEDTAAWMVDKGYATYQDVINAGATADYVAFINTTAEDNYWVAP